MKNTAKIDEEYETSIYNKAKETKFKDHHIATRAYQGEPWKQAEREVLKRFFLAYGFHRWKEVILNNFNYFKMKEFR